MRFGEKKLTAESALGIAENFAAGSHYKEGVDRHLWES